MFPEPETVPMGHLQQTLAPVGSVTGHVLMFQAAALGNMDDLINAMTFLHVYDASCLGGCLQRRPIQTYMVGMFKNTFIKMETKVSSL